MSRFDGGEYIRVVLASDDPEVKAKGGDLHSINCRAIGLDPKGIYFDTSKGRDIAKTWFYGFIYGAGDGKLGSIILRLPVDHPQCRAKGAATRAKFLKDLSAMGKLVEALRTRIAEKGYILGLDGRVLRIRSSHAALNTLLQSAGAVLMKLALVILDNALQAKGLKPGDDYEFLANVHDEWQIECREHLAQMVGETAVESIRQAGEYFKFPCPLGGAFSVGATWADTH
jgi:DNA polymerase I-like protein with 3'-5' exonuclease and polymerase domains